MKKDKLISLPRVCDTCHELHIIEMTVEQMMTIAKVHLHAEKVLRGYPENVIKLIDTGSCCKK